ncbi:MAG TPA: NUDIX domain-containing protein [Gemmatimonadales bacterium]
MSKVTGRLADGEQGAAEAAPRFFLVDVFVVRWAPAGAWEALVLRRASGRSPGSWEAVHGHVEPGERPEEAAWREAIEETGLTPERLYNLSRAESFYLHRLGAVAVVPAFAAVMGDGALQLSHEHDAWEWLPLDEARARFSWPRCRRGLADLEVMLADGTAGVLEDTLRVR